MKHSDEEHPISPQNGHLSDHHEMLFAKAERGESSSREILHADDEAVKGEVIEMEDEEEDCAPRRVAPDPGAPTAEEMEEHRIDHFPYRSWCEHCVAGRGTGEQHRSGPEGSLPTVACDYLLVTKKGIFTRDEVIERSSILMKILVVKDDKSRYIGAHVVPVKGAGDDRYAAERMRGDIQWMGYSRVLLRSDNEPAIVSVLSDVLKGLKVDVVDQTAATHPPAYDSKANCTHLVLGGVLLF